MNASEATLALLKSMTLIEKSTLGAYARLNRLPELDAPQVVLDGAKALLEQRLEQANMSPERWAAIQALAPTWDAYIALSTFWRAEQKAKQNSN